MKNQGLWLMFRPNPQPSPGQLPLLLSVSCGAHKVSPLGFSVFVFILLTLFATFLRAISPSILGNWVKADFTEPVRLVIENDIFLSIRRP